MKEMKTQKKGNDNSFAYVIGLFFLVSSAFFGLFVASEDHLNLNEEGQSDFSSLHKSNEIDKVNDHLKSVADKIEIDKMKTMLANLKAKQALPSEPNGGVRYQEEEPIVDFSDDPRVRQMAEQMGRTNEIKKTPKDPRSLVYDSVLQSKRDAQLKEEQRRRQAEEFVARARKDGWIVQLDKNYKIKSYRPVDEDGSDNEVMDYKGYEVVPK
jgi:hypothetical protein